MTKATHEELWAVCYEDLRDYHPYGQRKRDFSDCSCGCAFYHILKGRRGADWGVCFNPESHRNGFLTFEHQGCPNFTAPWDTPSPGDTGG